MKMGESLWMIFTSTKVTASKNWQQEMRLCRQALMLRHRFHRMMTCRLTREYNKPGN